VRAAGRVRGAASKWSCPELARELATRCQVTASASTVRRWLAEDAIKPWQHRSWISIRDPDFAVKAARVLDLYAGFWDGQPLGENNFVICADEKTSVQARCRCHPTLPPGKARMMRLEHDYQRKGSLAYLAACDVHRGQVTGRCEDTTGIEPFARLVEQIMSMQPYASAERVFWIVDNGSSHRGARSIKRLRNTWPNAHLVHLPVHASWLDQAEIYLSPPPTNLRARPLSLTSSLSCSRSDPSRASGGRRLHAQRRPADAQEPPIPDLRSGRQARAQEGRGGPSGSAGCGSSCSAVFGCAVKVTPRSQTTLRAV